MPLWHVIRRFVRVWYDQPDRSTLMQYTLKIACLNPAHTHPGGLTVARAGESQAVHSIALSLRTRELVVPPGCESACAVLLNDRGTVLLRINAAGARVRWPEDAVQTPARGRPVAHPDGTALHRLVLNAEERAIVTRAAAACGMKVQTWERTVLMSAAAKVLLMDLGHAPSPAIGVPPPPQLDE